MVPPADLINRVVTRAFQYFELDSDYSLELLTSKQNKFIYKATSPGNTAAYIVHVDAASAAYDAANEASIHSQLSAIGLISSYSIASTKGDYKYIEEDIAVRICPWIDGSHPASFGASPDACGIIGVALGKFHRTVTRLPHDKESTLLESNVKQWWQGHRLLWANKKARTLWEVASRFKPDGLPTGIIHGDIHTHNVLIHGDMVAFLDLEHAGRNFLILDVARAAIDVCADGTHFSRNKNDNFIKGYEQSRKLTAPEHSVYVCSLAYATLCVADWFMENNDANMASHFLEIGSSALEVL